MWENYFFSLFPSWYEATNGKNYCLIGKTVYSESRTESKYVQFTALESKSLSSTSAYKLLAPELLKNILTGSRIGFNSSSKRHIFLLNTKVMELHIPFGLDTDSEVTKIIFANTRLLVLSCVDRQPSFLPSN
jgi:hypothetical protein